MDLQWYTGGGDGGQMYALHSVHRRDQQSLKAMQTSASIFGFLASKKRKNRATRPEVVRQHSSLCYEGTINVGDVGEITARLAHSPWFLLAPMPLSDLIIIRSTAANQRGQTDATNPDMRTLWETGEVFFNHFVKVQSVPDLGMLNKAFGRGATVFFPNGY